MADIKPEAKQSSKQDAAAKRNRDISKKNQEKLRAYLAIHKKVQGS